MFSNSHLHISHGLGDVTVTATTLSFIDHMCSMSVFVFQIEKFCQRMIDENVIETRELVQFGDEGFTKSFVSATVRDLDNNFVAFFATLILCRGGH